MSFIARLAIAAVIPLLGFAQHPSVGVFLDFDSPPGAGPLSVMEKEVENILKASGVSLDWRMLKDNHGNEPFARLVVLKFKGTCKAEQWPQTATDFGSLGETRELASSQVDHGVVLPYGEVRCDELRMALRYIHPGTARAARQLAFGRAMARVVAHELYHMLAGTTAHTATGLAKASHSLEDLIAPGNLGFTAADSKQIELHP